MEIELKYLFTDDIVMEKIFSDGHIKEIMDKNSEQTLNMCAVYFDTPDGAMKNSKMAFRVRFENEKIMATLKWGENIKEGLHIRGELNVLVDEDFSSNPKIDIFEGSEVYDELKTIVGDKTLEPVMKMEYVRREAKLDTGKSISVLSIDKGEIQANGKSSPISELEIELYSGSQDDMLMLGEELKTKYNLVASDVSKYKRGLIMIGKA